MSKPSKPRSGTVRDTLRKRSPPTPEEVYEYFQTQGRYINQDHTPYEQGELTVGSISNIDFALPAHDAPLHGPVKTYTQKEIDEYMECKNDD